MESPTIEEITEHALHMSRHDLSMQDMLQLKSLEEQACHADPVTKRLVKHQPDTIQKMIEAAQNNGYRFEEWNVTSIGNLAYTALNLPGLRDSCIGLLQKYKEWHTSQPPRKSLACNIQ